jgi:hypothetical protein
MALRIITMMDGAGSKTGFGVTRIRHGRLPLFEMFCPHLRKAHARIENPVISDT